MKSIGWLILAGAAYYYLTQGGSLGTFGLRPVQDTQILTPITGGFSVAMPIPPGWTVWRLGDGSQVTIQPGAVTAPGGWVQGTHAGQQVWFNTTTGQMQ